MRRLLSNLLVASALVVASTAQTITIPQQGFGVEGPSTTAYPWSPGALATGCIRSQYFYTKNAFLNQSVNFPILITQLSWRDLLVGSGRGLWASASLMQTTRKTLHLLEHCLGTHGALKNIQATPGILR